ncbi:MAG: T9SS type A sorting domain-containing protein [Bacteroidota bacterium]
MPFDDANNDGYIAFKIKTKADLVVGDSIKNIANIYFDYNFPVETNEAQTTVQNPIVNIDDLSILLENLEIFPNPVLDILSIKSELIIEKIEIYDLSGRIIQTHKVNNNQVKISDLPTGTYFVKLHTNDKIYLSKLVKK